MKKLAALFFAVAIVAAPIAAQRQKKTPTQNVASSQAPAQPQFSETLYDGIKWRLIGPFRGGHALAVTGVPGQPNTYYFGAVAGGVWKTTDGGERAHTAAGLGSPVQWNRRLVQLTYLFQTPTLGGHARLCRSQGVPRAVRF